MLLLLFPRTDISRASSNGILLLLLWIVIDCLSSHVVGVEYICRPQENTGNEGFSWNRIILKMQGGGPMIQYKASSPSRTGISRMSSNGILLLLLQFVIDCVSLHVL